MNQCNKFKTVFVCTDQNFDLLKSASHSHTRHFLSTMLDDGYVPYILKLTRITHSTSSLIDNAYLKCDKLSSISNYSYVITDYSQITFHAF